MTHLSLPPEETLENFGYLPGAYYEDFIKFLAANKDIFNVLTFADLPWGNDYNYQKNYPQEWSNWKSGLSGGQFDSHKIHLIMQHDVDTHPDRTMRFLQIEADHGIRSNVMIFRRRIWRREFERTGRLIYSEYPLDYKTLQKLEREYGFLIGYHSNAYDQSGFDRERALQIFEEDVRILRKDFDIRFFSPHGGLRDAEGNTNNFLPIPDGLSSSLRWVANRYTPRFSGHYSDGGINTPRKNLGTRDMRAFFSSLLPGQRYSVLTHLQYYFSPAIVARGLKDYEWYTNLLQNYELEESPSVWQNLPLRRYSPLDRLRRESPIRLIKKRIKLIFHF